MCTGFESTLLSAAISGAGMLMQQNAADDAAEKQQSIINNAQAETDKLNTQKANTINKFAADTFNPVTRDQRYEQAATKGESSLADALLSANGGKDGEVNQGAEGNLSNDYVRGKATATANATDDIIKRAKLMARNNAGSEMYNDESLKGGQLASDVLGMNAAGQRVNSATKAQLSGVQDNGSLASGLLMAAGGSAGKFLKPKIDLSPSASGLGILGT
jgi:hypothetical protein